MSTDEHGCWRVTVEGTSAATGDVEHRSPIISAASEVEARERGLALYIDMDARDADGNQLFRPGHVTATAFLHHRADHFTAGGIRTVAGDDLSYHRARAQVELRHPDQVMPVVRPGRERRASRGVTV